jgi:DNA-binding transcriptional LysR family regulator
MNTPPMKSFTAKVNIFYLQCFFMACEAGSLRQASRTLQIPYSTLKKNIDLLQQMLGTTLLITDKDGCRPTDAGDILNQHYTAFQSNSDDLYNAIEKVTLYSQRTVQCYSPYVMDSFFMRQICTKLRFQYPDISFVHKAFGIEYSHLPLTDCALIFSPKDHPMDLSNYDIEYMASYTVSIAAHKDFLAHHGTPKRFSDLKDNMLIKRADITPGHYGKIEWLEAFLISSNTAPRYVFHGPEECVQAMIDGCGIGLCSEITRIFYPELTPILPSYKLPITDLFFVMNKDTKNRQEVMLIRDHIFKTLAPLREKYKNHQKSIKL